MFFEAKGTSELSSLGKMTCISEFSTSAARYLVVLYATARAGVLSLFESVRVQHILDLV